MTKKILSKYWLFAATALFLIAGYAIWKAWPSLIIASMQWQKEINEQLSELLYDAQTHLVSAGFSLVLLSFIYGILHSLGPGHGKLIVSTYVATHPTKIKISLMLTMLSALLQAVVAIILVSALLALFNSSMREVNGEANRLVSLSFYTVLILGALIIWRNGVSIIKSLFFRKPPLKIKSIKPLGSKMEAPKVEACGCGHVHFADPDTINNASSFKEYLAIILSVGLRPCTGAVMVLLFANMVDIYWLGVVSAFMMSIGTALTTSVIAIMTISGIKLIKRYMETNKSNQPDHHHNANDLVNRRKQVTYALIKMTGGLLLVLMGLLLLSSQPVALSPIF